MNRDSTAELTEEQLEAVIGPAAMREYTAAPDYDKPKIRVWAAALQGLPDGEFVSECASKIYDSALVQRFKGNWEGVHARASACYTESVRRRLAAGHTRDCRGDSLYVKGFNRAYASAGHDPSLPVQCSCGKEG